MTTKTARLKKLAFKEGVKAGAVLATRNTLLADYKALIRQWVWLEQDEQWRVDVYAEVLKQRGETATVKKFQQIYK